MATPLQRMSPSSHLLEPCTDFPTLDDLREETPHRGPSKIWVLASVVLGALLIGSLGFLAGRGSAPVPAACDRAVAIAERAVETSIADLGTVAQGLAVFLDGERPEAYSVLADARLSIGRLELMRADLASAAEACT